MTEEGSPASYRYQEALAPLAREIGDSALRKRLSEVLTLLDFNSTLNQSLELAQILDLVLFVSMGETRASWAGVLLRGGESEGTGTDTLRPAARRGRSDGGWSELRIPVPAHAPSSSAFREELARVTGAALVTPMSKSGRLVGVLLLGERSAAAGSDYGTDEAMFAEALSVSAAASIDNGRIYEELKDANRSLSFKVYQLDSLFDISRELNRSQDESRVYEVLLTNAMGHVLTTRALVLHRARIVVERGAPLPEEARTALLKKSAALGELTEDTRAAELEEGLQSFLSGIGIDLVVPLRSGDVSQGVLLLGPRASGTPPGDAEREFLRSLATQAAGALDNLRLTREFVEKQKIEKEMAIAREIQRNLLPKDDPGIEGWDITAINVPCLTVGGDYFDYVARDSGKHWLLIADVSGKGTGAALLMASVQAAVHALAGIGDLSLEALSERLNEIVYESTEMNRYVTAFFSSLDPETGEMLYVNAGHCYPIVVRVSGEVERLVDGGTVVGLMEALDVCHGRVVVEPGDVVVMFTDGLSETASPEGDEFGDDRITSLLAELRGRSSQEIVARLLAAVRVFAAEAGLADDLTLMVVQRQAS